MLGTNGRYIMLVCVVRIQCLRSGIAVSSVSSPAAAATWGSSFSTAIVFAMGGFGVIFVLTISTAISVFSFLFGGRWEYLARDPAWDFVERAHARGVFDAVTLGAFPAFAENAVAVEAGFETAPFDSPD